MNLRLLAIELRRNERLWLYPIVIAVYGLWVWEFFPNHSLLFWSETSVQARNAVALLGPMTAAVAAWAASREHRRGLDELVEITPRPALARQLTVLGGSLLLSLLAYVVVAVGICIWTAGRAAGDGPYLTVQLPALAGITAMATIGFAAGRVVPRRTTPILAAAVCSALLALPITFFNSWLQLLSPVDSLDASPWFGIRPDVGVPQALFLLGLAGFGLAATAFDCRARRFAPPVLIGAVVLILLGVGTIHGSANMVYRTDVLSYEPVCAGTPIVVCVHPQFEPVLDDLAEKVNLVGAPFAGLGGVPARFEQRPSVSGSPAKLSRANPGFHLDDGTIANALSEIANQLVRHPEGPVDPNSNSFQAQTVVQIWLLEHAGVGFSCEGGVASHKTGASGFGVRVPCDALAHFAALDPPTRQRWLHDHFADLRAGRVTVEDLP